MQCKLTQIIYLTNFVMINWNLVSFRSARLSALAEFTQEDESNLGGDCQGLFEMLLSLLMFQEDEGAKYLLEI